MTDIDWNACIAKAIRRCDDIGREEYIEFIDDVVGGLDADTILDKHKIRPNALASALAHVTASVHGPRPVPSLAAGGWYADNDGVYTVAPAFAAAWIAARSGGKTH